MCAPSPASILVSEPSEAGVNESTKDDLRPDLSLIAALNDGDAAAFDALCYRHRDWVANFSCRYTRSHDLSVDVLQETFLYVVKKFPGFTLTCQLRSFLYPDESQVMQIRVKLAVIDIKSGGWTMVSPNEFVDPNSWGNRFNRDRADQKQVQELKELAYAAGARQRISQFTRPTRRIRMYNGG